MKVKSLFITGTFLVVSLVTTISCNLVKQSAKMSNIQSITWQQDKYLWASENDKLIRWNVQTQALDTFKDISGKLLVDSKNSLWVFDQNRIAHLDGQTWQYFTPNDGFVGGSILSVVEDEECIWLGTAGLSCYDQQDKSWRTVFTRSPGTHPTPSPGNFPIETLVDGIHSITSNNENSRWIGTSRGLIHFQNDHQQMWGNDVLKTDGIRCLLPASNNDVWACGGNGVGLWNGHQWSNFIPLSEPVLLVQGEGKDIWVATWESGVARWNGDSWDRWDVNDGLSGYRMTSLLVSTTDGNTWIGSKSGINRWDGDQWRIYKTTDGLTSDYINVLFQDPRGVLWAGTNKGLNYYNPNTNQWYPFP